ncbi:MAG: hypothetical protein AABM31_00975 [Actinomycetota bacterium]
MCLALAPVRGAALTLRDIELMSQLREPGVIPVLILPQLVLAGLKGCPALRLCLDRAPEELLQLVAPLFDARELRLALPEVSLQLGDSTWTGTPASCRLGLAGAFWVNSHPWHADPSLCALR